MRHLPALLSTTLLSLAVLTGALLLSPPAHANPDKVADILRQSGNVGVARGPKTINNEAKAKIRTLAERTAAKTGGKVYVVILAKGTDLAPYAKIYDKLGLAKRDVLYVSNGSQTVLRCNGISKADKTKLMASVMKSAGDPMVRLERLMAGLPAALGHSQGKAKRASGRSTTTSNGAALAATAATQTESSGFGWGWMIFLLLVVGGVAFVIWRRKQRDGQLDAAFKAALDPAENHMADFYLGTDGFEAHPQFSTMLARGTAISAQIDALKAQTPTREAIAKAASLAKDAAALESELRRLN